MALELSRLNTTPVIDEFENEFNTWLHNTIDVVNGAFIEIEQNTVSSTVETSTAKTGATNSLYIINNASTTTITLPSAPVGSVIEIVGKGAGGWVLATNSQTVQVLGSSASTSVASTNRYDCISVMCVTEGSLWVARHYSTSGFTIT